METAGKVLGIGLSRTGTQSLCAALTMLGYRSAHFVEHLTQQRGRATWFAGDFAQDCLADCDAATDLPIPVYFPQLDDRYPNSKFILTVREVPSWLESMERHWQRWPLRHDEAADYRRLVRLATYGVHGFSRSRLTHVYETHADHVYRYFRERPHDLLVMNICAGEGWDKLCPFLDRPAPRSAFPWLHRGNALSAESVSAASQFAHESAA
jgi:hypothetical protein